MALILYEAGLIPFPAYKLIRKYEIWESGFLKCHVCGRKFHMREPAIICFSIRFSMYKRVCSTYCFLKVHHPLCISNANTLRFIEHEKKCLLCNKNFQPRMWDVSPNTCTSWSYVFPCPRFWVYPRDNYDSCGECCSLECMKKQKYL